MCPFMKNMDPYDENNPYMTMENHALKNALKTLRQTLHKYLNQQMTSVLLL